MRTGIANFTLDYGKAPRWLVERMIKLGRIIGTAIVEEFGPEEFLKRLADPVWFQSFGCVLAFDWNASGLTTTTMGALKQALRGLEKELGIFICGGKGKTSRKTPEEIIDWSKKIGFDRNSADRLVFASKAAAKVDSCLIQDSFQIYHHNFIFSSTGKWAVIQQGMNTMLQKARRYHWFGNLNLSDFVNEPHSGIASQLKLERTLNLTSKESELNRLIAAELANNQKTLLKDINLLNEEVLYKKTAQISLIKNEKFKILNLSDKEFNTHPVIEEKIDLQSHYLRKNFDKIFTQKPRTFQELMMIQGVGPKTIRSLSLVAEIIYGAKPSYEDPARYSFAHGGKDNIPYPVDRKLYDKTIEIMEKAVNKAKIINLREKNSALKRIEGLKKSSLRRTQKG